MTPTTRTLDLDTLTLASGAHDPGDAMCVMEAVAWVAGEPWSDHPACASVVIGTFLRSWNDALDDDDRQQLRRWVLPVVGTAASAEIEDRRAWMAADWLVRTCAPAWLRLGGLTDDAAALEALTELTADALVDAAIPIIDRARAKAVESAAWSAAWSAGRLAVARSGAWSAAWLAGRLAVARSAVWSAVESAASESALRDTVVALQASAHDLIGRMVALTNDAGTR